MKPVEIDFSKEIEGSYVIEDQYYVIQDEKVFVQEEEIFRYTEEFTAEQVRLYGELLKTNPTSFELNVLEIKILSEKVALIHVEDGSDADFWIYEERYDERKDMYVIGQKGFYSIFADILTAELPEDFRMGVILEGEPARQWFAWLDEDVEEDAGAYVGLSEMTVYEKTEQFDQTGIYMFNANVSSPGFTDNPGVEEGGDVFMLALMNQFNKEDPRFITASFVNEPYTFPAFEPEDEDESMFEDGWALKGTMRFVVGVSDEEIEDETVFRYGSNQVTFPEAKGFRSYDDEDYLEDEESGRYLDPAKMAKYEDRD